MGSDLSAETIMRLANSAVKHNLLRDRKATERDDATASAALHLIQNAHLYDPKRDRRSQEYFFYFIAKYGVLNFNTQIRKRMVEKHIGIWGHVEEAFRVNNPSLLTTPVDDDPSQQCETKDLVDYALRAMFNGLNAREIFVVCAYYFRDRTYKEIGQDLKLSIERCRQICLEALGKLRARVA